MSRCFNSFIRKSSPKIGFRIFFAVAAVAGGILFFALSHYNYRSLSDAPCSPLASQTDSRTKIPRRIVSTSLASDEVLVGLLNEANRPERLVAVSHFVDDPKFSSLGPALPRSIARVGNNLESLAQLKPDLVVFASFNRPAVAATLGKSATRTCFLEKFESLTDIRSNIVALGLATGLDQAAAAITKKFEQRITREKTTTAILTGDVGESPRAPSRLLTRILSYDGSGTVMAGKTTFDDVVHLAGGKNAASDLGMTGWPRVNEEAISRLAPDLIVLIPTEKSVEQLITKLETSPGWRETPAVRYRNYIVPDPTKLLALGPSVLDVVPIIRTAIFNRRDW